MRRSLICSGLAGLALATFIGSGAIAETVTYKAAMNAQSEVPPNAVRRGPEPQSSPMTPPPRC